MKNIFNSILLLIAAETIMIPIYYILVIGLAFNDSGFETDDFMEFISIPFPVWIFIAVVFIAVFFLNKLNCHRILLKFIYIPIKLLMIAIFFFSYMGVYMTEEVNNQYNPVTIIQNISKEAERAALIETQEKEYGNFINNQSDYEEIHTMDYENTRLTLLIDSSHDSLYIMYEDDENSIFKSLPQFDKPFSQIQTKFSYPITDSPIGELLYAKDSNHHYYIMNPSNRLAFQLFGEPNIIVSNERNNLEMLLGDILMNNVRTHSISYKNGNVYRTGEIDDDLTWEFFKNGEKILGRDASDELSLELSSLPHIFDEQGEYSAYLTSYIEGGHRKVSNTVHWSN
ncbi:hypothetical protein CIL03_09050 [Virgibacillus indicus]|uniref:Uncharacterized protein n=1 Tax=Virgibacillus indicus TaxID=2024554 RepID=A0A265NAW9_9BACI|nr:hypothetical protein [Virgibacillus indicus]OZU89143.1 hypothetical protein CIL03_09050 [Virgibacillus indicus]